jgi:hypothetical protein
MHLQMGRRAETVTVSFLTGEDRAEFIGYARKLGFGVTEYVRALHQAAKALELVPDVADTPPYPRILVPRGLKGVSAEHGRCGAGRKTGKGTPLRPRQE